MLNPILAAAVVTALAFASGAAALYRPGLVRGR
jgi:hypothetical protein